MPPLFQVELEFTIPVEADNEEHARTLLREQFNSRQLDLSMWTPVIGDYVEEIEE